MVEAGCDGGVKIRGVFLRKDAGFGSGTKAGPF